MIFIYNPFLYPLESEMSGAGANTTRFHSIDAILGLSHSTIGTSSQVEQSTAWCEETSQVTTAGSSWHKQHTATHTNDRNLHAGKITKKYILNCLLV